MDGILKVLLAVFAALNAATGAPVNADDLPDRPAIVAPTLNSNPVLFATTTPLPATQTAEIDGIITTIQGDVVIVGGQRVTLVTSTKVNGQLQVGATLKGQVRILADGKMEADRLEVGDIPNPTANATQPAANLAQPTEKTEVRATETKPAESVQASPTEKPEVKPTEKSDSQSQPQPTEKPDSPSQPQPQPTEKPDGS